MRRLFSLLSVIIVALGGLLVGTASPAAAAPTDGAYKIINERSGKCLDQSWTGGQANQEVLAYNCLSGYNQVWSLRYVSGVGNFVLVNRASGMCLNQSWAGGVQQPNVIAYKCSVNGGTVYNDWWHIAWTTNRANTYAIGNSGSGGCLDQDYTGGVARQNMLVWKCKSSSELTNNVTNQHWRLVRV